MNCLDGVFKRAFKLASNQLNTMSSRSSATGRGMICRVAQCMTAKAVSFDEGRRAGKRTTAGKREEEAAAAERG